MSKKSVRFVAVCDAAPFQSARQVAKEVNGPLMQILGEAMDYHDASCVDMFRHGGELWGFLQRSGNGIPVRKEMEGDIRDMSQNRSAHNRQLIASLKEDKHSEVLMQKTLEDAKRGRMTQPRPLVAEDLDKFVLSPRFAVEQGALTPVCVLSRIRAVCTLVRRRRRSRAAKVQGRG